MRTSWIIGPRETVSAVDTRTGLTLIRHGKNGGPSIKQSVTKVLTPR